MRKGTVRIFAALIALALAAAPLAAAPKVKLTVWYGVSGASGEAFKALLDKYSTANPNVEITASYSGNYSDTATKVSAALVSNTAPDVALMAAGPLYTGGNGDFYMESKVNESSFKKSDIFPGVWEYTKFNGRICAVPYGISTPILYYNKDLVEKAGVNMAKSAPKTWNDLYKLAKLVQDKNNAAGASISGFDVTDVGWLFKTMLNQNGNNVINVKKGAVSPAFNDAKGLEVATFWKRMIDDKVMAVGQHSNAEKAFLSGNVAFLVATSARIAKWSKSATIPVSAVAMPYFKKPSVALGGNVLVILGKDKATKDAAWDLVKFLASTENQTDFALKTGYLPIRKSGVARPEVKQIMKDNPMYAVAFNQLGIAWSYWHFEQMGTMDSILWEMIDNIERGTMTPKDALDKAAKDLQNEIDS